MDRDNIFSRLKVGFYFTHYECFGHTSRVMAVAEVIKKRFPKGSFFFIQAGVRQPKARIKQMGEVYILPGSLTDRRHFRKPAALSGDDAGRRSRECEGIVGFERPDLFMTEFFPLGRDECRHELLVPLTRMSLQGTVLWSIAGYPLLTGKDQGWRDKILKLFQQLMIFAPTAEKELMAGFYPPAQRQGYLDFFQRHASKIKFAGYLLPQQKVVLDDQDPGLSRPPVPRGACRVAVLRGGGAYYPKVIAQAIRASDILGKEYDVTVAAGPSTTAEEWDLFNTLVGKKKIKNLVLLRSVGDYEGLIKTSDVCVSVASYHTSVMLLKHRKKAVLIPFEGYGAQRVYEQQARALMLKELMGSRILSIDGLTADHLAAAIQKTSRGLQFTGDLPQGWFTGAKVLDKALKGLGLPPSD